MASKIIQLKDRLGNCCYAITHADTTFFTNGKSLTYMLSYSIPTKVSQLTNDSEYITEYIENDPTVPYWVKDITQTDIDNWSSYANVNADWDESNTNSDSFILNKPDLSALEGFQVEIEYDDQNEQYITTTEFSDIFDAYDAGKEVFILWDGCKYYLNLCFEDDHATFVNVDQGNTNMDEDLFWPLIQQFNISYNNGNPIVDFYLNGINYDDEPTEDSMNLMTSGSIYSALNNIQSEPLLITVSKNENNYEADYNYSSIQEAIDNNRTVFVSYSDADPRGLNTTLYTLLTDKNTGLNNVVGAGSYYIFENELKLIEFGKTVSRIITPLGGGGTSFVYSYTISMRDKYTNKAISSNLPITAAGVVNKLNDYTTYTQANSYYQPIGNYLTEHQSLTSYVTSGYYDTSTHKIYLRHGTNVLSEIDANDFIKDGMVDTAYVSGSYLVISFNTDAGKQPVEVPIANIFNPTNYYTKTEINNAGYLTAHQDLSSYVSKTELNAAGYLTSHQDIKTINNTSIIGTGNVTINGLPEVNSTYNGKILQVVDGAWTLVTPLNLYSGTGTPSNSQGNNGDLYMQI